MEKHLYVTITTLMAQRVHIHPRMTLEMLLVNFFISLLEFLLCHLLEFGSYEYFFCDRENIGTTFDVLFFQTSLKEELF